MGKAWERGDYCDCFPDKLFGVDMSPVCLEHDLDYSSEHPDMKSRKEADLKLRAGVYNLFKDAGKPRVGLVISTVMYLGVRIGGWAKWKTW